MQTVSAEEWQISNASGSWKAVQTVSLSVIQGEFKRCRSNNPSLPGDVLTGRKEPPWEKVNGLSRSECSKGVMGGSTQGEGGNMERVNLCDREWYLFNFHSAATFRKTNTASLQTASCLFSTVYVLWAGPQCGCQCITKISKVRNVCQNDHNYCSPASIKLLMKLLLS